MAKTIKIWDGTAWQDIASLAANSASLSSNIFTDTQNINLTGSNTLGLIIKLPTTGFTGNTPFQIKDSSDSLRFSINDYGSLRIFRTINDSSSPYFAFNKNRGSIVQNGDGTGQIDFLAHDGSSYQTTASIKGFVDAIPSLGSVPGRLTFSTSGTDRLLIDSSGRIALGNIDAGYVNYGGKLSVMSNSGTQASIFLWQFGVGSGHIGIPANSSNLRIVNTYSNGLISSNTGIDIDPNGRVGIGTASPAYSLDSYGGNANAIRVSSAATPTNTWAGYRITGYSGGVAKDWLIGAGSLSGGANYFAIYNGSADVFSIQDNGYVGINGGSDVRLRVAESADNPNFVAVNTNSTLTREILHITASRAANSAYIFFKGHSSGGGDTEFNLRGDGQAYADGSWNAGGADYAEYFEWLDGNINNENRKGYSVSLVENKIKIAQEGEIVIGVISANPSIVGDAGWNSWNSKYLLDEFNDYVLDENGDRVLNPEYDSELEYVSRESRPEWAIVGLMGKLRLRKGQVTGAGWIKMRDISSEVEEWLVK